MTTEVAVINRIGVALATDSAVTISSEKKSKVFDSGDKLFELDCSDPVGVMINGNMDLQGIPWELIIKDFRTQGRPKANSIQVSLQKFLDFAGNHPACTDIAEDTFAKWVVFSEYERIKATFLRQLLAGRFAGGNVIGAYMDAARVRIEKLNKSGRADSLRSLTVASVRARHGAMIDGLIKERFENLTFDAAQTNLLRRLGVAVLLSKELNPLTTGMVVGGYSDGDLFPSIAIAEVEGTVCGKLKYTHGEHVTIDHMGDRGRVISFAQTDVADRLLSGADAQFVSMSAEFFANAIGKAKDAVVSVLEKQGLSGGDAAIIFDDVAATIGDEFRTSFAKGAAAGFQREFNEMVALMPKQNLIELAEALVSITAIERKAVFDLATVGGPVDVAFITRHEGFVWIKRKHYFESALNPRFFWRKYGQQVQPNPSGHAGPGASR